MGVFEFLLGFFLVFLGVSSKHRGLLPSKQNIATPAAGGRSYERPALRRTDFATRGAPSLAQDSHLGIGVPLLHPKKKRIPLKETPKTGIPIFGNPHFACKVMDFACIWQGPWFGKHMESQRSPMLLRV